MEVMVGRLRYYRYLVTGALLFTSGAVVSAQDLAAANRGSGHPAETVTTGHLPAARVGTDQPSRYAIGVADSIRVNVWKNPELSGTLIVDPNGSVSLPLLGDVHVAGMTTSELGSWLSTRYASYVVTPQVTVSVVEIRSRQVYVMGQVGKAGGYPLLTPLNVLQLIAQAGGLTPYAKRNKIYILRAANGQSQKIPFSYASVTHGDSRQDIPLQPGDTVIVP